MGLAGLELGPQQVAAVTAILRRVMADADVLDEIDLTDVEPELLFYAGWD